ncbi:unnamed protein product [Protopolystoma xenopodis]|uniref:Uncharacterized protein n=1 Tax=Protopolystoma xenopodis TaxID=117903 RepID=A0A448XE33_9PLAT|nr:unnamed protein product [Protopolystoma xenopodis]
MEFTMALPPSGDPGWTYVGSKQQLGLKKSSFWRAKPSEARCTNEVRWKLDANLKEAMSDSSIQSSETASVLPEDLVVTTLGPKLSESRQGRIGSGKSQAETALATLTTSGTGALDGARNVGRDDGTQDSQFPTTKADEEASISSFEGRDEQENAICSHY